MSAVTNALPPISYTGDNQGHFDSGARFTHDPRSSAPSDGVYPDSSGNVRQKEQMQEALQIQQIQAEQSQMVPQQYQFQGPMPLQLKYAFRPGQKPSFPTTNDPDFDGRRLRRTTMRKTVDYNSAIIKELENRLWQRDFRDREHLQPDVLYIPHILPPPSYRENPFNAVTTRFVKTATNKVRCPVFCLAWTPEGRRLITGTSSGEFTLWNGLTFNFETILQAHDCPVRTMVWSNNELWMLTGDHSGFIKYWQSNMNNVKMYQGHREAVRGISFSPTDNKFVSCSDDGTVRLWDFNTCNEERIFRGHGADVKCVSWHPYKSLVASGSKDNQQPVKLWDPRSGKSIATIHAHKATVMDIKWNQNGNWVATASRDHLIKLYDIRNLGTDMQVFRGHKKETSVIAWHPQHEGLICSGGSDGSILFWHVGTPKEVAAIDQAHDSIVWALAWHPLGHILCSGSNDHSCKFWTRNHPGDPMRDKYNLNTFPQSILGFEEYEDESGTVRIPGMGPEDKVDASQLPDNVISAIPGLDNSIFKDKMKAQKKVPYAKPIPKNFQAQWNSESRSKDVYDENFVPDARMLANKLFEHAPGAISIRDLKVDAIYMYGKVIPVKENSELARVIPEGRDRLTDFVNGGNVPELNSVIPHFDPNEYDRRCRTQYMMKSRGRQFNEAVSTMLSQLKKPDRSQLKRSKETNAPIPNKKWRSDTGSADYRESGSNYNKNYPQYKDTDYRQSSKDSKSYRRGNDNYDYEESDYRQLTNDSKSYRRGNDNYDYDDNYQEYDNYDYDENYEDENYDQYNNYDYDYDEGERSNYPDKQGSNWTGSSYQGSRGRGESRGGRSSYRGRGAGTTGSSWRGSRGKDAPRRYGRSNENYEHDENYNYDNNYEYDYEEGEGSTNYPDKRSSNWRGSSFRSRGEPRGGGRGSYRGRGTGASGSSWRGTRGKDMPPRRPRVRGSRRGM